MGAAKRIGADARFRNERAHLNVLRRQKHHDRFARRDPLALAKQRVVNKTRLRRRLFFLVETPVCLIKSSFILISSGTRSIQILSRSHASAEKLVLSGELPFSKHERRLDLLACRLLRGLL